jgi:fructokinase
MKKKGEFAVCMGNIAYDLITTDKKNDASFSLAAHPGGSVLNTALILPKLGCRVRLFSKTGKDFLGDRLKNIIKSQGVKNDLVLQDKKIKTGLAVADIDRKGDSSYIFYRPENPEISLKTSCSPKRVFKECAILHTASAYTYKDITFDDAVFFIEKAREKDIFVTYDPNWRKKRLRDPALAKKRIKKILEIIDLLKLSDEDALEITSSKALSSALKKLPPNTIVTLGEKGSFHKKDKDATFTPAFRVRVVDTIGAGDAFTAGLIARYMEDGPSAFTSNIKYSLLFASAAAALVCTQQGASKGLTDRRGVHELMER